MTQQQTNAVVIDDEPPHKSRQVQRAEWRAFAKKQRRDTNGFHSRETRKDPADWFYETHSKYVPHTGAKEHARHG